MSFTDLFIRRPVLASVISLLILALGFRSAGLLPIRQYPLAQNAVVTVSTTYVGADPELVAGFITTPLENSISQANGIDYLTSTSALSRSTIQATLLLNYDPNQALTEISTRVNAVLNELPPEAEQPVITVEVGETVDSMYIGFSSTVLPTNKITDYLIRVVQPKLLTVEGVQTAEVLGQREFALRAWLDPDRLAAYGLTATDVRNALSANDFISALGSTKGSMVTVDLTAETGLHSVEEFRDLVVKSANGAVVRLRDVANVTLGAENYDTAVSFNGKSAVYIGIKVAPTANLLTVVGDVRGAFPAIAEQLPEGLSGMIVYDSTKYVNTAIREVIRTLLEAILIVVAVIFLFLGSIRSVAIPAVAIPLSLVGTLFIMLLLGFTVNLLTLLALVLAIGIVVDDAIIVVENVHRHIEEGVQPMQAAVRGARELANPIIAMTIVLIAVYIPIGFMGGLTGELFTEFAYTLAGAVTVSGIIALTLSPMMSSRMFKPYRKGGRGRIVEFIDRSFDRLRSGYERTLHKSLDFLRVTIVLSVIILAGIYFLHQNSETELVPQEDQGIIIAIATAAPDATLEQTRLFTRQIYQVFTEFPETDHVFQFDGFSGVNSGLAGMVLRPWDERERTAMELQPQVQMKLGSIAGIRAVAFQPSPLPGSGRGLPVQFVIETTDPYERLHEISQTLMERAQMSGLFAFLDSDLKIDKPQVTVEIDRDKAAQLGITMRDIGNSLGGLLGGNYVNYFSMAGRSYKVIPQVMQQERLNAEQLKSYYFTTQQGVSIPASTFISLKQGVVPGSLNHFQQLNAATISAMPAPGVALGDALNALASLSAEVLPSGYGVDYAGQSRQYMQESTALLVTFFFALITIFLALAALFESFRDPLIVMVTVPLSVFGALVFISMGVGGASLNIYTQVGLVTLIGLISRHGILIVQFANDLQRQGKEKREAVEIAAAIRLRPVLMTTAATVLGVVPLVIATGAGAEGRYNMGLVIMTGLAIGTLFTLFVVPAVYLLLAAKHRRQKTLKAIHEQFGKAA